MQQPMEKRRRLRWQLLYAFEVPRWFSGYNTRLPQRQTWFGFRRGSSRIFARGNHAGRCRRSAGFLGDLLFLPLLHSGAAPHSPRFTHIGSQYFNVKSRSNLSTRSLHAFDSAEQTWERRHRWMRKYFNILALSLHILTDVHPQIVCELEAQLFVTWWIQYPLSHPQQPPQIMKHFLCCKPNLKCHLNLSLSISNVSSLTTLLVDEAGCCTRTFLVLGALQEEQLAVVQSVFAAGSRRRLFTMRSWQVVQLAVGYGHSYVRPYPTANCTTDDFSFWKGRYALLTVSSQQSETGDNSPNSIRRKSSSRRWFNFYLRLLNCRQIPSNESWRCSSSGCRTYVEVTPFLSNLHLIGAHDCEVFIYWRRVTRGVSTKEWSNDKLIAEIADHVLDVFKILTADVERGGAVRNLGTHTLEDPGSNSGSAILISVSHGFRSCLQVDAATVPFCRSRPNHSHSCFSQLLLTTGLHHCGSKIDPRSHLRSTLKTVAPFEFRAGLDIEMNFISNRRNRLFQISIRDQQPSSTNIDHSISDRVKMLVQPGISRGVKLPAVGPLLQPASSWQALPDSSVLEGGFSARRRLLLPAAPTARWDNIGCAQPARSSAWYLVCDGRQIVVSRFKLTDGCRTDGQMTDATDYRGVNPN
ncbi:hypothetical protein PR048_024467 [Dryococelus australis]|uniref:Uncharacterized protein n=1 Tax=Dryococelus australis TaxID=614101 RepID=A0ABQ9GNM9_9NEOP|nr:hypothetical protein PR048_024467 [Dryococelus australis]